MTDTQLSPTRYRELTRLDTSRMIEMAERGLDAAVPPCPGWTVADVVSHQAMVYAHKVRVMADGAFPQPWPPDELVDREPIGFLRDAEGWLFDEFDRHEPTDATATFGADKTIAFWLRRMALEVAVHRYDTELAHDDTTSIPDDLAVDGVDEVLRVMLGGPWWDGDWHTEHPVDAEVAVAAGSRRWLCALTPTAVSVRRGDEPADLGQGVPVAATVSGSAPAVFLWLWGRADDDVIAVEGDAEAVREFRLRTAEASG